MADDEITFDPWTGQFGKTGRPLSAPTTTTVPVTTVKPKAKPKKSSTPTGVYTSEGLVGGAQNVVRGSARGAGTPVLGTTEKQGPGGETYVYQGGRLVGVTRGVPTQVRVQSNALANEWMRNNPYGESVLQQGDGGVGRGLQMSADVLAQMLGSGSYAQAYQPSADALAGLMSQYQSDLNTGAYAAPVQAARDELTRQMGVQTGNLDTAQSALLNYLGQNMANPFAGLRMQAETVDPQFAQLLKEQGVADVGVQAELADTAAAQQARGGAFQNLVDVMSGLQSAGLSSRQAEAAMADTFARQQLANTAAAYGGQFGLREAELRQGLMDRISEGALQQAQLQGQIGEARSGVQQNLLEALSKGASVSPKQLRRAFATGTPAKKQGGKGKNKGGNKGKSE